MKSSKLAVFISGGGSNLQAIIDRSQQEDFPGEIAVVISNRRDSYGLERARKANIPALWISHRKKTRQVFEQELIDTLGAHQVDWVALAGFMRVLTPKFILSWCSSVSSFTLDRRLM